MWKEKVAIVVSGRSLMLRPAKGVIQCRIDRRECFQVSTGDNKRFRLCYNVANDKWSVTALVRS